MESALVSHQTSHARPFTPVQCSHEQIPKPLFYCRRLGTVTRKPNSRRSIADVYIPEIDMQLKAKPFGERQAVH